MFFPAKSARPAGIVKNQKNGFTLFEVLLVIAILAVLVSVSLPSTINFYQTWQLDLNKNGIAQALRRAQLKAISVEADSSFGIYLAAGQYILFKGSSFASRDPGFDESFELPDNLYLSGLSEIVFTKLQGIPSAAGNIFLTVNGQSKTININEQGRINYD